MTMLSFRLADAEAGELQHWVDVLGVDRSEFLRDAVHRQLVRLRSEAEAARVVEIPPTEAELSLGGVAEWGPAEDWTDWHDAAG